jgi:acetoacetyl-CoA reductase
MGRAAGLETGEGTMARVAVVTGGTRGIGKAISVGLKNAGYKVAASYHGNDAAAQAFTKETGIATYKFDVADFGQCEAAVKKIVAEVGPVDVLVNNAGITRDGTMHKMTPQQWAEVIQTNLGSCFNMCRCVIDGMRERSFGRIVNIGSINGQAGQYGQVNYAAAKSGIHGFTKALAQEGAAKSITVNAIAPGYIDTEMVRAVPEEVLKKIVARIPVGRLGKAEEIARGVLFLVADEGGFITGSTISINGGQHMYSRRAGAPRGTIGPRSNCGRRFPACITEVNSGAGRTIWACLCCVQCGYCGWVRLLSWAVRCC